MERPPPLITNMFSITPPEVPGGGTGRVKVDLLAAGAVGIDRVTARLTHSKIGQLAVARPKAIGRVINLCEVALTVKPPDADDKIRYP